jgi:acetylornithine/N-succinyldiaminopimelate aminotransferase
MEITNESIKRRADMVFIGTYQRYPTAMIAGSGCELVDADGKTYLDFLSGIAVCSLGHCHPAVTEAICTQASRLVHVSNLYYTQPQTELAELLIENSFADKIFMANSGAEANEAAIKLARIASDQGKYEIVSLAGSFHGRTLATVAATAQPKFHQGFEPLPEGFVYAEFGDPDAIEQCITPRTCAIIIEALQGEGGVRPLEVDYLKAVRALCDRHGLLLIVDEVQTGMGRTGTLFAHEQFGVVPDIMTVAKALGNGLPIGALLTTERLASFLVPGTHASTFGGNPVACAAAVATLKIMLADGFLDGVQARGRYFRDELAKIQQKHPTIASHVRGMGLLNGLVLTEAGREHGAAIVNGMFEKGVLINYAGNCALRFAPPLIVDNAQIDRVLTLLDEVLGTISA